MTNNRYIKFILSVTIIWLFTATFLLYGIAIRKINIGPNKPYQIVKLDNPSMPLVRFNQQTGATECWSTQGGGWIAISSTSLVTVVSIEERTKRKETIDKWYQQLNDEDKKKFPTKIKFEPRFEGMPSWQIEEDFKLYQENPKEYWEREIQKIINLLKSQ